MEKTTSSPYWTGLTVFTIGSVGVGRKTRRRHLLNDALYSHKVRLAYKGQLFSAPMDWKHIQEQLEECDSEETKIVLPVVGELLASRVRLCISAGLVDLNKCLKEATLRRNVVMQLIRMHRDAGDPDYQNLDMREAEVRARTLSPNDPTGDTPTIPLDVLDVINDEEGEEAHSNT